jgi:hypothetical protein
MAKKKSSGKSKVKSSVSRKDATVERMRKGRQEQVDEIAGLMRQLDPTIKTPKVK